MSDDPARAKLTRDAARLVRKIARLLAPGPEQTSLFLCADQIEEAARAHETPGRRDKLHPRMATTRPH